MGEGEAGGGGTGLGGGTPSGAGPGAATLGAKHSAAWQVASICATGRPVTFKAQPPVALQLRLDWPLTPLTRPEMRALPAQVASAGQEQVVVEQVNSLRPAKKVQPVAAHLTSTRGLATANPMVQLGPA